MTDVYIITMGEYSDYSIVSVWLSKEVAEQKCKLLNAGARWIDYRVEEYPLDSPQESREVPMIRGFKAFYDLALHGFDVDTANVVFNDALFNSFDAEHVHRSSEVIDVLAVTKEKCLRVLFDTMALEKANREGLTQ